MPAVDLVYANSSRKDKRFVVSIKSGDVVLKRIHFGQPGAFTFFDGASVEKRDAYLKRHAIREDWGDPFSAGFHARFVLWSHTRDLKKIERELKKNSRDKIKSAMWLI